MMSTRLGHVHDLIHREMKSGGWLEVDQVVRDMKKSVRQ